MSASRCIAFFGILYPLNEDQIEGMELKKDYRIVRSKKFDLEYYWGNFSIAEERYLLLIGMKLGILGLENELEINLGEDELYLKIIQVKNQLIEAKFKETPSFHFLFEPDN